MDSLIEGKINIIITIYIQTIVRTQKKLSNISINCVMNEILVRISEFPNTLIALSMCTSVNSVQLD